MPRPPETITEARRRLAACSPDELDALIRRLSKDPRTGVRQLAQAARSRLERQRAESARLDGMMALQARLHQQGFVLVAGIDEVGRGALAGPVSAAAVVLDVSCRIDDLADSKKLTPEARARVAEAVRARALAWCVGHASPAEIDRLGIGNAVRLAWQRAFEGLSVDADHVLIDGNDSGRIGVPTTAVVKGDASEAAIAAASVLAKVERDGLMADHAVTYHHYGFEINRGYGTPEHLDALRIHGPCEIHRRTFAPCTDQEALF